MKNREKYTDRQWEELASMLSGEESENSGLLNEFTREDLHKTGEKWNEINDMKDNREIDVDKAWENVSARLEQSESERKEIRVLTLGSILLRAAAIALILVSVGTGLVILNNRGAFSGQVAYSTGNDQKNLIVNLGDGSKVILNRNSELTFRKNFGKRNRNVNLTGEAFFEIAPDASKPFIIDAGQATVKVVGTSFNVITSNQNSEVEVFVKTGKVLLSGSDNSESIELDPGYVGKIDEEKAEKAINTNPNYMSWNTNLLTYNGQSLDIVFRDLKRVYNMDIVADDKSILENRWTSPIDNQTEETIIRLICVSFNLGYTKDGNVYHLVRK
jgi:ferric-dicitrate binding protein FerR (iron transport regulator)